MQAADCLDDLADSEDGIKAPLGSSKNMSLWSSIALKGCSFLRKLFSIITNIRILVCGTSTFNPDGKLIFGFFALSTAVTDGHLQEDLSLSMLLFPFRSFV